MKIKEKILRKAPYRGVISEIAKELHTTPSNVHYKIYKSKNTKILEILLQKIFTRKKLIRKINESL